MIKVTDQQVREAQDGELLIVERSANTPANPNRLPMGVYYRFKGATKSIFSFIQQSGSAAWGSITGTLSDQTDLQNALDAKLNNPNGTSSQFIKGDGSLDSTVYQPSLGFTPEDVANKKTTMSGNTASNTFYLTAKAIYDWATTTFQSTLGYTAENVANKSTSVITDQASNTKYPSVKAVYDWAVGAFQGALGYTPEDVANKTDAMSGNTASSTKYLSAKGVYDWVVANFNPKTSFTPVQTLGIDFTKTTTTTNANDQVIGSVLIPAHTFGTGSSLIEVESCISRLVAGASPSHRICINTTPTYSISRVLAIFNLATTTKYSKGERTFECGSNYIRGFNFGTNSAIDDLAIINAPTQITVNWSVNQYILTVINNTTGETTQHEFTSIELKKV
jgi:hypothetical protein